MGIEAGQGGAKTYSLQIENDPNNNTAPFEARKHYVRIEAIGWYVNKQSNFWTDYIASGTLKIKIADELYEVGLGTYKLDAGMKTAPIFNRPLIEDRAFYGGSLTLNAYTRAIKKDTLLGGLLKDLGSSTIDIVNGAIQGASLVGPAAGLLNVSKGLSSNIKEILEKGEKQVDLFSVEDTYQLSQMRGNENYILLHRGSKLDPTKLKVNRVGSQNVSLAYNNGDLEDGVWVLLRLSRIDKYSGVRPWFSTARTLRADMDKFIDNFELGAISKEKALEQLTPSDQDPNSIASKFMELITLIRNDYVLSYRDALRESAEFRTLLDAARTAVNKNDANEYRKVRDNLNKELTSGGAPNKLIASIVLEEFKSLSNRDGSLKAKTKSLMDKDLWRSIRYSSSLTAS